MSRSKDPCRQAIHKAIRKVKTMTPEEVGDLRRARPTKRILEQIRGIMADLGKHSEALEAWSSSSNIARSALETARIVTAHGDVLLEHLKNLDSSGFSPPRKCYTASTTEGDVVQVLAEHRDFYSDFMGPENMTNLRVVKKQPGKGGGLVVEAADGARMRVAIAHVVKTS
jgi:hypothetical protein